MLITHTLDKRYTNGNQVSSHDGEKMSAVSVIRLKDVNYDNLMNCDIIGVDEGQFFPDVVEFANEWVDRGKVIILAGLDGTFDRKPFGQLLNVIPFADTVEILSAVCVNCGATAPFSKRLNKDNVSEKYIGGVETYAPMCRTCFERK